MRRRDAHSVLVAHMSDVTAARRRALVELIAHTRRLPSLRDTASVLLLGAVRLALCVALVALCAESVADTPAHSTLLRDTTHFLAPEPVLPLPAAPTPDLTIPFAQRTFETGVAFPRWSTDGYGDLDAGWHTGLGEIQQQTQAGWVEMMIQLYQTSQGSTSIYAGATTPSPESVAEGVRAAHTLGYHVFIVPLLGVLRGQPWGGAIHFGSYAQTAAWFHSYWNALEPYLQAAAESGAEQFAIGTELSALETAGDSFWRTLIGSAHATFPGALTYDMNWSTLGGEPQSWMSDPRLTYLGISEYAPIASGPWALSTDQIAAVWQQRFLPGLERLSAISGKSVLLSEIGYRNARDALYRPWDHTSPSPPDPTVQASAYEAALRTVYTSRAVAGIFFWAWSVEPFAPNYRPAAQVLRTYYGYYAYGLTLAAQARIYTRHEQ